MIRRLIEFSLRFPPVVAGVAIVIMVAGAWRIRTAEWDVFPEFAPPQVVVQTEAAGLSTEEVEQLVTLPVEAALGGVSRLATLRSSSVPGLCVVTAIFEGGTDVLTARQLVSERLTEVRSLLPELAETPRLMPLTASTSRLLMIGLTGDERTTSLQLRTLADWTIRRRLQAVPGVAHVEVFGGAVKQYRIDIVPEMLQASGTTLADVLAATRAATGFGGAGFLETANQRLPIRQRTRIEGPDDLAAVPVAFRDGVAMPLSAVAEVRVGAADRVGSCTINGQPGVLLVVHRQPDVNTLDVTAAVGAALDDLGMGMPKGVTIHPGLFRQAAFIERALGNLWQSLLIGCVLVAVVLAVFLLDARVVFISLTAIPLSLLGAILVICGTGASLNAMTLGGLAIALGEVVDDAIVDVENVVRRLAENRLAPSPRPVFDVVLSASLEVRSAVVYASFIVMLVFLPVFFLDGLAGRIFGPLGFAYIMAILVSLVVALTVTPALALLLVGSRATVSDREPVLGRVCAAAYRRVLGGLLVRPRLVIAAAAVLFVVSIAAVPFLGGEFLPDFRESNFVILMAGMPDSSLAESERVGGRLSKQLLAIPGVRSVAQQIGRADLSEDTWGPNISEVWVSLDADADYDLVLGSIRDLLDSTPGYAFQVKQFLRERIDEVLTGSTADLVVRLVGPDLDVMRRQASAIADVVGQVDGVKDVRLEQLVDVPQIEVFVKPQATLAYGLSVGGVNADVQAMLRGVSVGQVFEYDTVFDVVARLADRYRDDPHKLQGLPLDGPSGDPVPLSAVADVGMVMGPNMINREQGRRRLLVTCNAEGRDVESVMRDIQARIVQAVRLPPGYHVEFGGEFEAKARAQARLAWLTAAALLGILLVLYVDFASLRWSLIVMISVPLACAGGVAAVVATGGSLSLGSLVGFVTVFGVAVRNGILLVSTYRQLEAEGEPFGLDLILRGSVQRLAPILMTAATTAFAIVPLVVAGELPGHEIEYPMAIVIMGGLVSSTLLTLLVLPAVSLAFGGESRGRS
jgi:CzcA family heavy metal efflux pump